MYRLQNGVQASNDGVARPFCTAKTEKRILFLKNEPGKLLKIKDEPKKTNRKQTGNKATEVVENKESA